MLVTMSNKELHCLSVIQAVIEKRLRRRDAASQLDLTERQVQRLMNRYRESGAAGLTDARRGKPGTHRIDEALRHRILTLLRENYVGFGPTLAAEKLQERHGITISVETLDDRGRTLDPTRPPSAPDLSAAPAPGLPWRAYPDRRLTP